MSRHLLEAEDLLALNFTGDPQVSPKKDQIAYVLTKMDLEKDGYGSSIFVSDLEGQQRRLTYQYDEKKLIKDMSPRWSPDGEQLAFLSNRSGSNQVWSISLSGGEAVPLTSMNGDVTEYVWSADGTKLALTVAVDDIRGDKSDVKVIMRLRYKRDGTAAFLEKRTHIFLFDLKTKEYAQITEGDYDFYCPCFSPDGNSLLYIGSKLEDQEVTYIPSIWEFDLVKKEESLFFQGNGPIRSISFSPDGKWVAFIGHDQGEQSSANKNLWVISTSNREIFNVTKSLDRTVDNLIRVDAKYDTGALRVIWNQDSSVLFFTATNKGGVQLYNTTLNGQVSQPLTAMNGTVTSFAMIDDQQAVLVQAHNHSTGDIVIQNTENVNDCRKLTAWNDTIFSQLTLSTPENFRFKSFDGMEIEGWILRPAYFEKEKQYPLVLQIHGGPHSAYGYGFQHEWQLMAAKGYAIVYMNPRGSQGYGQEFVNMVVGDWGGDDYKDLMAGVDYALENYDFIDKNNLFVTGASYGGYMTNMIVARTERFKAAVTQNSVTNLYSMFGTSDIGFYFNSWQLGNADMWEDEEKVMEFSPIRYARNVKTPTLVMQNEKDYRCPMEQGEQWYIALRRLGVATKLIRFPDESHGMASSGKPSHRLERLKHLLEWFDHYKGE
ncbi:S9 family peptidase [Bacillaceae bacterium Marseille-Q3522]|nr:S9 family peptidase [Bacillaceae bacterium Marseille-Q3522]